MKQEKLIRNGDVLALQLDSRGYQFCLSSQGFYPSSTNLKLKPELSGLQTLFVIYRKGSQYDSQPAEDEGVSRQPINYEEIVILRHYLSQKFLCVRENESSVMQLEIRKDQSAECQFKILPLFKCQTINSRRVRQDEDILIASAFLEEGVQNYMLAVSEAAVARQIKVQKEQSRELQLSNFNNDFFLNKSVQSRIRLSRKGQFDNGDTIVSRKLFRIKNIQSQSWMSFEETGVVFNNSPNEYESFLYLVSCNDLNSRDPLEPNSSVYVRSQKYDMYLEATAQGIKLTEKPSRACEFQLIEFRNSPAQKLTTNAVYFLRHAATGRNISAEFNQQSNNTQCRLAISQHLKDTVELVAVSEQSMTKMLFLSQIKTFLELINQRQETKNRAQNFQLMTILASLLEDMIGFIYRIKHDEIQDFTIKFMNLEDLPVPNSEDQSSLYYSKIINHVLKLVERLAKESKKQAESAVNKSATKKEEGGERNDSQRKILKSLFILIGGMCIRHIENTEILLKNLQCISENLNYNCGALQCFIQVFRDNKKFLKLIEDYKHDGKSSVYSFLQKLKQMKRSTSQLAINICAFLKCLSLSNNEPLRLNQTVIGEELETGVLDNTLLMQMKVVSDGEFLVKPWNSDNEFVQIQDMYLRRSKHTVDIALVQQQLDLYSSLCHGRNYVNIQYFRKRIPYEMIVRYMNKPIDASFKSILLKLFVSIYLDVSPLKTRKRQSIICLNDGPISKEKKKRRESEANMNEMTNRLLINQEIELAEVNGNSRRFEQDTINLEDIQSLLLQQTENQINQNRYNEAFHMYVEVLSKFIAFDLMSASQKNSLKNILEKFLSYKEELGGEEKQHIYTSILNILVQFEEEEEENRLREFVSGIQLRGNLEDAIQTLQSMVVRETGDRKEQTAESQLLTKLFDKAVQLQNVAFLDRLIMLSQRKERPIANLLRQLKSVLVLKDSESIQLYNTMKRTLISELDRRIENFNLAVIRLDRKELHESTRRLNATIEQVNLSFYSSHSQQIVDPRNQNLIRQLGIHNSILNFLVQNFKEMQLSQSSDREIWKDLEKAFKSAFRFLTLFVVGEQPKNLKIIQLNFPELQRYLDVQDFGQKRFFLELCRIEQVKPVIEADIVNRILQLTSKQQNIYMVGVLIEYTKKQSVINKRFIDDLARRLIAEQRFLEGLLKAKKTVLVYEPLQLTDKSRLTQLIYYVEVFKLLNIICQHISEKKYFHNLIRRFLPLQNLLRLLRLNSIFDDRRESCMIVTIMQREVLKMIELVYLQEQKLSEQAAQLLVTFLQKNQKLLNYYNEQTDSQKVTMLNEFIQDSTSDCNEILHLTEGFDQSSEARNNGFLKNFDFMLYLLTRFGPIAGQLVNILIESDSTSQYKKQAQILKDSLETLIQDSMHEMLTMELFERHPLEYLRGMDRTGEAFKTKFKLPFQSKLNEEIRAEKIEDDGESTDLIVDKRLRSIVDSYKRSNTPVEKSIYKVIFQLMFSQSVRKLITQQKEHYEQLVRESILSGQRMTKVLAIMVQSYTDKLSKNLIQKRENRRFFKSLTAVICHLLTGQGNGTRQLLADTDVIQCSIRYMTRGVYPDLSIISKIIEVCVGLLSTNKQHRKIQEKFQKVFESIEQQLQNMFNVLAVPIEQDRLIYSKMLYTQERVAKVTSQTILSYETGLRTLQVSTSLQFYGCLVRGDNKTFKEYLSRQSKILENMVDLVKIYLKFVFGFTRSAKPYYPYLLDCNLCRCIETILEFLNYQPKMNINIIVQKNFFESINSILSLNDGLKEIEACEKKQPISYIQSLISECQIDEARKYLRSVYYLCVNTERFYKQLGGVKNPFLPVPPNYVRVKTKVISILSELINIDDVGTFQALFKSINEMMLKRHMLEIYEKHLFLFNRDYVVQSFDLNRDVDNCQLSTYDQNIKAKVEASIRIENGFNLLFILFKMEDVQGKNIIQNRLDRVKEDRARQASFLLVSFCKDFASVCTSCFTSCCSHHRLVEMEIRSRSEADGIGMALDFFIKHSGRVEIAMNERSYMVNFPILPECQRNIHIERAFLKDIDLSSVQSKNQSMMRYTTKFIYLHENEEKYKRKYKNIPFIDLLLRYIDLFKNFSFIMTVILNAIILVNSDQLNHSPIDNDFNLYDKLMTVQATISILLLIFFTLKEMPLVILETNRSLEKRRQEYGSNFSSYPKIFQWLVWLTMICSYPPFLYHTLYTVFVIVAFFDRIFISVLLLDIFVRIPLLRRILMSIWRPKVQIVLTIIAFILMQYYFVILLYYNFQDHTYGMCSDLQNCFSFVYYVIYKVVGGFPGYIFQYKQQGKSDFSLNIFAIFEDIYVVITYQIFFAVLGGIIIDNFSIIRAEEEQKQDNLLSFCLVCGNNRNVINEMKKGSNFSRHIMIEHNVWNYFNYVTYVHRKMQKNRTQLEQHVVDSVERGRIDWLPSSLALVKI